jgi:hypothetical protein
MLCPVDHLPSGSYSKGAFHPMNAKNLQRFEKQLKDWLSELVPEADAKIKDMQRLETRQAGDARPGLFLRHRRRPWRSTTCEDRL